jgi:5-(carboxyamino)imidazole ribonucleotide synthase
MKLGILGSGQLARMLILQGRKLGIDFEVYAPQGNSVEGLTSITYGQFDDTEKLRAFMDRCSFVTYEWENLPIEPLKKAIGEQTKFFPDIKVLEIIAGRFEQKSFFRNLGIPTAPFCLIEEEADLIPLKERIDFPLVLKTNRFGYDGKGQKIIHDKKDLEGVWQQLGQVPLIAEKYISFKRELSLVACRSITGEQVFYPLTESFHQDGILRKTVTPAEALNNELQIKAQNYAKKVFEYFDYVGVLALELFEVENNLLLNEMASRVHNTGHWSIEGAETSQFENHIRAGLGLSLGAAHLRGPTVMLNLIGQIPEIDWQKNEKKWHVHLYGKAPKEMRKLGHVTCLGKNHQELIQLSDEIESLILSQGPKKPV